MGTNVFVPETFVWGKPLLDNDITLCSASGSTHTSSTDDYVINVQSNDAGMQVDVHHGDGRVYYLSFTWDEWADHLAEHGNEKED